MIKRPGIGYKHYDALTIDSQPTYKPLAEVPEGANATWTLLCCIALIKFLKEHVAGDGFRTRSPAHAKMLGFEWRLVFWNAGQILGRIALRTTQHFFGNFSVAEPIEKRTYSRSERRPEAQLAQSLRRSYLLVGHAQNRDDAEAHYEASDSKW
ncbi:hypothetical protein B0H14DRAFT_2610435 [Mycena olivaceomarginata]|nr:hypothetical protein B0H14DRAFT_2610435 [Mycena olivaceomarginata]